MFQREWTMSLDSIDYLGLFHTLGSEYNWEDLCMQLMNEQTCNYNNHN